jgi:hypothetical protein
MKTLRRLSIGVLLALVTSILTGPPAWADSVYCTTTDSVTGLPTNTGSFTTDSFNRYTYDPYSGDLISMPTLVTEVTGGTGCAGTAIIPDGVTSIGVLAFSKSELTSITLPSSVTSIDVLAFNNTELTSITLPSSVISIGDLAFYKSKLTSVKFEGEAPTVGGAAFAGIPSGAVAIISPSFASSFGSTGAAWNGLTLDFLRNVNFDANGGTGTMSSQVAAVTTALTTNNFARDGFDFAGWNTATNGSGTDYADGASYAFTSDVSLYAQWIELPAPAPAAPAPYSGPTPTNYSDKTPSVGDEVIISGLRMNLVTSLTIDGIDVPISNKSLDSFTIVIPIGISSGLKDLVMTGPAGKLTALGALTIQQIIPAIINEALVSSKPNAGSFNGYVAVYAKGHKGKTLSWKIAGKWFKITITSDYQVFQRRTAAVGLDVDVHLYIDGEKRLTKTVTTR